MKKCQKCRSSSDLITVSSRVSKDGTKKINYMCNKCNRERKKTWYHRNPENKLKVEMSVMKSYAKRFGYRLVKIR